MSEVPPNRPGEVEHEQFKCDKPTIIHGGGYIPNRPIRPLSLLSLDLRGHDSPLFMSVLYDMEMWSGYLSIKLKRVETAVAPTFLRQRSSNHIVLWNMPSSLFTKPSVHVATTRQLPQHPKMRLSYILNPSTPTTQTNDVHPGVPESSPPSAEAASGSPSFHDYEFQSHRPGSSRSCSPASEELIAPSFISPDVLPFSLSSPATHHGSTSPDIPSNASPVTVPQPPHRSLPSLISSNSNAHLSQHHDSSHAFATGSAMNKGWNESPSLGHGRPIRPLPRCSPPAPTRCLNLATDGVVIKPQSHSTNSPPSSPTIIHEPPQHPKMRLSYILNPPSPTTTRPKLADSPHAESRSPSPTISEYCLSSLSDSPVHRLTVLPPPDDESLASPVTTPPSSPPPVPTIVPDLPLIMVEPPQLLPGSERPQSSCLSAGRCPLDVGKFNHYDNICKLR
ncbi:hypothetical protein Clacol_010336 [Clathrus columnatus]|uniref:Uncharacterized protein n=1 Tax=Clathrus columnatus TaxID=1419009 RepID=A0AAV5AQG5_9AGAM|nr:hypothetical protein Clacol_010336 [Clathrus columnatus]